MTRIDLNNPTQTNAAAAEISPRALERVQARSSSLVSQLMSGKIGLAQYAQSMELNINEVMKAERIQPGETTYRKANPSIGANEPLPPASTEETRDPNRINQLAYSGQQLGNGRSTLSGAGCILASTTMAANRLNGTATTLPQANVMVRNAGQFSGSDMNFGGAANALGTTIVSRRAASDASMSDAIARMQNRRPPTQLVVGVDYKDGHQSGISSADHWVNVHSVSPDGRQMFATDPVGGREITFNRGADGEWRAGKYRIAEVSVLASRSQVPNRVAVAPQA